MVNFLCAKFWLQTNLIQKHHIPQNHLNEFVYRKTLFVAKSELYGVCFFTYLYRINLDLNKI